MAYQTVLAVLRGGSADPHCLHAARLMARPSDGHVDVLHVRVDPRGYLDYTGDAMTGNVYAELIDSLEQEVSENAQNARAAFDAWTRDNGIDLADRPSDAARLTASWRERTGSEERVVGHEGRLFDLLVLPTLDPDDSRRRGTVVSAIFDSGRPLLLVPQDRNMDAPKNIVIFWNGSAQAARTVEASLPLLQAAESVDVAWVEEDVAEDSIQTGLSDYLAWHGVSVSTVRHKPDDRLIGEMLVDEAEKGGKNLIVMGGYSHSRLREFILGGVTQHILENPTLPVFLAH